VGLINETLPAQSKGDAPMARPPSRKTAFVNWLPLVPFFLFAALFLFLPSVSIFIRSFESPDGGFTFDNIIALFTVRDFINAYKTSLTISVITATGGAVFGFLLAHAIVLGGLPKGLRTFMTTFSGVASNFAGVPLAFAFIATMGNAGLVTRWIESASGIDIHQQGFTIYNITGLSIVYMYFQFPLMVLIMAPASMACAGNGTRRAPIWAVPIGITGDTLPSRSCYHPCLAQPFFCLAMPLARMPLPTRSLAVSLIWCQF